MATILRMESDVYEFAADRAPTKAVQQAILQGCTSTYSRLTSGVGFSFLVTTASGKVWQCRVTPNEEKQEWQTLWARKY